MRPFHATARTSLHLGDCEQVLAAMPPRAVDVVVTDPPWNLGLDYGRHDDDQSRERYEAWLARVFAACTARGACRVVYLPGRHHLARTAAVLAPVGLVPSQVLRWDTGQGRVEPVVVADSPDRARQDPRSPAFHSPRPPADDATGHPCPKPMDLLEWVLRRTVWPGATVLDPFAGTGTTLVAAARLGVRAVGIEQEARFCAAAAARLRARDPDAAWPGRPAA